MPRNVRNFWLELSVDGSKSGVSTGPRNKDGGFHLRIRQRSDGGIITAATVDGFADSKGNLTLTVRADDQVIETSTVR